MYQSKDKKYGITAIIYYIVMVAGYFLMGVMYKNNLPYYAAIPWVLWGIAVLLVRIMDKKKVTNLGFSKEKIKANLLIAGVIVLISVGVAFMFSDFPALNILKGVAYYLIYIALFEEMIFRGFLQNYLFGIKTNKFVIYILGALFFSLIHIPFQMYVHDTISISYLAVAAPQLIITFFFHLLMCFITYKRKDILIPTALHFVMDFMEAVF